ncbi:sodium/solute symporter [Granulicella sp. 5B5]|uniref:sodium:solute symporter family transporter n=1 Tax=Granulicella sp. 5B5 TaxID=1617967 RepID=UPI0015F3A2FC|nr:sodium/solute symporter [Granulicella sp. 5B5]QMV17984.1 sodium/solute symporter [Granulicella sp. 5B5]
MHLHPLDLAIVAFYLLGITAFGLRFAKRGKQSADKSLKSYFLASNTIPWWAIALSIVSAETSTLTIISIPGVAFAGDFGFLQIVIGYMLGRIVVAALFLPRYFAGEMLTAYQLIDRRFGRGLHKVTAGLFLLTRAAAEGVRVFAVSIVVSIAIGTGSIASIGIISALTLLYTFEGGMAAVIWTDVVQMAIYMAGTLVAVWSLGAHVPGGWTTIHTVASAAGKFHMFNFALNLTTTYTFWAGILGGTFLTMASHGTDQLMVQRMLAARNLRESRLALLSSGVVIFIQFALFLLIGVGLWVFYGAGRSILYPLTSIPSPDQLFPTFIVRELPIGIAGLLVAAILAAAMSNLSAALNSLSSTTVVDFYMALRPHADNRERALISRSSTVLWAIVLFAIAIYSLAVGGKGHVVEIGLSIASVAYGCLLGVFLLGTLTKFATETGTAIGMLCGFVLNLWLWQGAFPIRLGPFTIPHIAWTWYVLIGALATFLIGALMSLIFRKQSRRPATVIAALFFCLSFPKGICVSRAQAQTPAPDFSQITQLITTAIADHQLPGAVVLVGHNNHVVFEQAYGDRKLANEPGLNGEPNPAEPMTEDTIFDMASLSKDLATATSIMQLYEAGRITSFDDPVEKYLSAFNPQHDATRSKVTLRMLLTHTSGEAPDVSLKDPWGLAAPDRSEGFRRALTTALIDPPGAKFVYSDVNFILLGDIVETLSGEREDIYARQHIFLPLGMTDTEYHPFDRVCGPHKDIGAAVMGAPSIPNTRILVKCPANTWSISILPRTAPTTHDDEGNAQTNPHFDLLTRGTVHDPTTRRMGGVAGHAGVFSTAHDVSLFASALLEKLLHNTGPFPLKQSTLQLMTQPEQPNSSTPGAPSSPAASSPAKVDPGEAELRAANAAEAATIAAGDKPAAPGLAPHYPAIPGQNLRGYGWDIDTAFSKPRGVIFPIGSFGHTGYTGTTLWMDPYSDTYVVLLSNAVHPRDRHHPISNLRGEVATAAAQALGLSTEVGGPSFAPSAKGVVSSEARPPSSSTATALTGIDVLEATHFAALTHYHHIGLLTNQTGIDAQGRRTIDVLYSLLPTPHSLSLLFTPEHGLSAQQDTTKQRAEKDQATHLPVISLYGAHDADRRPTHAQLADLDAVVIDLQDAGVHFWTYEAAMGYFLEAAATEQTQYHHALTIVILDRPNPVGGLAVQGPVSDPGRESYVNYMPLPVRHGMTFGELARYIVATKHLATTLVVVPMQHWQRSEFYADTGLPWVNPSPNLRSPEAALRYPALGLIEYNNISVGRGTDHPFSFFGAGIPSTKPSTSTATGGLTDVRSSTTTAWFHAQEVANYLTARHIPGVTFAPTAETIAEDANHYPFHGQTIEAVRVTLTDPHQTDTPELGIEILSALHHLYPTQFHLDRAMPLVASKATMDALEHNEDPRSIAASWQPALDAFRHAAQPFLLY